MAGLLVGSLEIAVLLVAALPFARVWLEPGFRRKLVVFPRTALTIIGSTALVVGGTLLVCLLVPHGLTIVALATLPAIAWERLRARPGHGGRRGLPPGSLALAPRGPWRDHRFYERQAERHGPVFKVSNYVRPAVCVVGLERGLRLLKEHGTALDKAPIPFSRRIPDGFLRFMGPDAHRRYRPLLATAISADAVRGADGFTRSQIRATLAGLAGSPGEPPERALRALTSTIFVRLTLGLEPGDRDWRTVERLLAETDYVKALWRRDGRVERALVDLTNVVSSSMRAEPVGRRSFASELARVHPEASTDVTALRNLVYILQTGGHDVGGLYCWLVKVLADHPEWLRRLRADEAGGLPERIVLETLRLRQSEYLARRATRTFAFDGFEIPRGWLVRVCVAESHRDPSVFLEPDRFDPDRWLGERPGAAAYSPFGVSGSSCLGRHVTHHLGALLVRELARYDLEVLADGPLELGAFHWCPSRQLRLGLTRVASPPETMDGAETRTRPLPAHA